MMPRQKCPFCQNQPRLEIEQALRREVAALKRAQADAIKAAVAALARIDDRKLACSITSLSAKLACAGNDGGEHSDVCDLVEKAVREFGQELIQQLRSGADAPGAGKP